MPAVGAQTGCWLIFVFIYSIWSTDKHFCWSLFGKTLVCVIQCVKTAVELRVTDVVGVEQSPEAAEQVEQFQLELEAGEIKHIATAGAHALVSAHFHPIYTA